jgi:hypothetical protein
MPGIIRKKLYFDDPAGALPDIQMTPVERRKPKKAYVNARCRKKKLSKKKAGSGAGPVRAVRKMSIKKRGLQNPACGICRAASSAFR